MYIVKYASRVRNAAIAQPVERILGKDEVASSNLASSSKIPFTHVGGIFTYYLFALHFSLKNYERDFWKVRSNSE